MSKKVSTFAAQFKEIARNRTQFLAPQKRKLLTPKTYIDMENMDKKSIQFNDLNKEQLWALREEICLNSVFVADYRNSFGFNANDVASFFEGYYDFLWEIGEEKGYTTHQQVMTLDDNDTLEQWFYCYDDLSWVRKDEEED